MLPRNGVNSEAGEDVESVVAEYGIDVLFEKKACTKEYSAEALSMKTRSSERTKDSMGSFFVSCLASVGTLIKATYVGFIIGHIC